VKALRRRRDRTDGSGGSVVVQFSRKKGLGFGMLFALIVVDGVSNGTLTGNATGVVFLIVFALIAAYFLWGGVRARPSLLIDPTGLTFFKAGIHLDWAEVATVGLREWQSTYDLSHRLDIRAVHPERFDGMLEAARPGFGFSKPRDGRIGLMLDLLSPSSRRIAEAIRDFSGGKFAPEVRRVGRRPFRDPEPNA
jgi:hypothetical protein